MSLATDLSTFAKTTSLLISQLAAKADTSSKGVSPAKFGATGAGDNTVALQKCFNFCAAWGFPVDMTEPKTYQISQVTLNSGLVLNMGEQTLLRPVGSPTGEPEPSAVTINGAVTIRGGLKVSMPGGSGGFNAVGGTPTGCKIDRISVVADARHQAAAVDFEGGDIWIGSIDTFNVDNPINFNTRSGTEATGIYVGAMSVRMYRRAVRLCLLTRCVFGPITTSGRSSAATKAPGNNGMLLEGLRQCQFTSAIIEDSGEHGIRFGGSTRTTQDVTFGPVTVKRSGGCGIKLNPSNGATDQLFRIKFGPTTLVDIGEGTTGGNAEALRMNMASDIEFASLTVIAELQTYSCTTAIQGNDVERLTIGVLTVRAARYHWLVIHPTSDGTGTYFRDINIGTADVECAGSCAIGVNNNGYSGYNLGRLTVGSLIQRGSYTELASLIATSNGVPYNLSNAWGVSGPWMFNGYVLGSRAVGAGFPTANIYYEAVDAVGVKWVGNPKNWTYARAYANERWRLLNGNYTLDAGDRAWIRPTNARTITLPPNPVAGDWVHVRKTATTQTITITAGGTIPVNGASTQVFANTPFDKIYVYVDATEGWVSE